MRRGTVFHPRGGQSMWIRQPSLGPSPLVSGAQQAPSSPPRGRRPLKWAPRLQTPETCLCPVAMGGHWWLTPSLCLWTCHARVAELQLRKPSWGQQKTAMLCQKVSRRQRCLFPSKTRKTSVHGLTAAALDGLVYVACASMCWSLFGSHVCVRECVYQYLSSLCIEANYYQSLQLKPDYARLNIALFVCSSGQEFPHVLTRTEPRVGCMRNTSVVHRASLSLSLSVHKEQP